MCDWSRVISPAFLTPLPCVCVCVYRVDIYGKERQQEGDSGIDILPEPKGYGRKNDVFISMQAHFCVENAHKVTQVDSRL